MKKMKMFTLMMLCIMALTGCGGSNTSKASEPQEAAEIHEIHLAAVLGNHDNAPLPNLGLIEDLVYKACYTYGSVTLICDDGEPYSIVIDVPKQKEGLSDSKYQQIANDQTKQILTAASQMQAKAPEVDTLKAIQLGSRSLSSAEAETDDAKLIRQMVIVDSCLSTTGVLSFSEHNLNNISSEDIVSQLKEMDEIPVLDNVEVTVYTCGDADGEKQKILPEANRKAFKKVWKDILEAGNAKVNMKDDLPLSSAYDVDTLPSVSPVTIVQDSVEIKDGNDVAAAFKGGGVISFSDTSIAFEKGSAGFTDKEMVKKELDQIAEYMNSHPDFQLLVCGTTACWGGKEYCMNLSDDRANAVGQLLINEFGIDKSRIKAVGVGYSFDDFYIYDQTSMGELDDVIAPKNRTVKLVDLNSDTADKILSIR